MDFQNIIADYASLFDQGARILTLRLAEGSGIGEEALLPHRLSGREALSECYRYELECLSPDTHLELKSLLGLPAEVDVLLVEGGQRVLSGLVTLARQLGSDGGFSRYGLTIEPALATLQHRRNSRVFQDKTVPEIVAAILDEHRAANAIIGASFEHRADLSQTYPARSYCLQYRESDRDFIERLLREEGISYRFAFSDAQDARSAGDEGNDTPVHTLVLFDDALGLDQAAPGHIRFHRADGTEGEDAITHWQGARQIQSGRSALASFDYKAVSVYQASESTNTAQGEGGDDLSGALDHYDPQTLYYGSDPQEINRYAQLRQQAKDLRTKTFQGQGTGRHLTVGTWFELQDHPIHDQDTAEDRQFLVTQLIFEAENNLPKGAGDALKPALGARSGSVAPSFEAVGQGDLLPVSLDQQASAEAAAPVYRNQFQAVRRGIPVVPEYTPAHAKPKSSGPQTATVVGPAGEEIYTDELGRIKIQFHWQRTQDHPDGGANLDEQSSTWVRVAYPSAGAGWGSQYIPRIGQEVVIDFIEGDIDRPIVAGVVHNGTHLPPTFSGAGSLPANKTLSGIKTKEYKGAEYNELVFDDTTGETRTKLSSEHGKTQLNQGYLIHPRTEGKGEPRGEGFELRTDDAGALRAAKGLILTTDARYSASGKQLDRQEALSQLEAALDLANALSDTAEHQLANKAETGRQSQLIEGDKQPGKEKNTGHQQHLKDAIESWERGTNTDPDAEGGNKEQPGGQGTILVSARAGIALTTPNSATLATGTNLDQVAHRDSNQTTGRRWIHNAGESLSLFVAGSKARIKETLKLIAAKGKVQIFAQSDEIELTADQHLQFTAVQGQILVQASQHITLTSGGGYLRLQGGNIEVHCPGVVSFKAGNYRLTGAAGAAANLPFLPKPEDRANWIELDYRYPDLKPMVGAPFKLRFEDGPTISGKLDAQGFKRIEAVPNQSATVEFGEDERKAAPRYSREANALLGQFPRNADEAARLMAKYIEQEAAYYKDNYFPEELAEMSAGIQGGTSDISLDSFIEDYRYSTEDGTRATLRDYRAEHPEGKT